MHWVYERETMGDISLHFIRSVETTTITIFFGFDHQEVDGGNWSKMNSAELR